MDWVTVGLVVLLFGVPLGMGLMIVCSSVWGESDALERIQVRQGERWQDHPPVILSKYPGSDKWEGYG